MILEEHLHWPLDRTLSMRVREEQWDMTGGAKSATTAQILYPRCRCLASTGNGT